MFSCDTMVVYKDFAEYGQNILAKNSDRPTGEPQPLCFYKGQEYEEGAVLQTTHLAIPQAQKTYSVVGSRPYWIWGFEMGYNEKGLIIGNEAEGSRMESEEETGILGMDLLRIGLERAATAREAIEVITSLLKKYGQKARASMLTERTYENSFILVDPREIWVLETAGREWVAKEIKTVRGVSNCYSIGDDYDMCSANVETIAREKRWLSPDEKFDFAKAYTGRLVGQPFGVQRYRRLNKLLSLRKVHDFSSLSSILRDHHEEELISPRFGAAAGTFMSVCMHMRDWGESETSASLLAYNDGEIGIIGRYAPAQPCLSAYIPVYMTDGLPEIMETAEKKYDPKSLWWQMKLLSLLVAVDEERLAEDIRADLKRLETDFAEKAQDAEEKAKRLCKEGAKQEGFAILNRLTKDCTDRLYQYASDKNEALKRDIYQKGGIYGRQKEVIEKYIEYAEIPL